MTGSGACVFAALDPKDAAQQALSRIPRVTEAPAKTLEKRLDLLLAR